MTLTTQSDWNEVERRAREFEGARPSKETIIIPARNITDYLSLRKEGWKTAWSGEGRICMERQIHP